MIPDVWVAFAVGLFLGAPAGVMLAAILAAGARADIARDAYLRGMEAGAVAAHEGVRDAFGGVNFGDVA